MLLFGEEDAPAPTFEVPIESLVLRLPSLEIEIAPADDELKWRLLAILLQVKELNGVGTMEWPGVRREFTVESAKLYVRELAIAHVETQRKGICAKWTAGRWERARMVRRRKILESTDEQLHQEDFDLTCYVGRRSSSSGLSEALEVLVEWVKTPKQLALAARMKVCDKHGLMFVPGRRNLCRLVRAHRWLTEDVLCDIWPTRAEYVHRMWDRLQAELHGAESLG
jgi:hypothetical protein